MKLGFRRLWTAPSQIAACLAFSFVMLVAAPSGAEERSGATPSEPTMTVGVWCDTADQREALAKSQYAGGLTALEAARRTNIAADDPTACIVAAIYAVEGSEVRRLVAGTHLVSIRPYRVLGAVRAGVLFRFPPQEWFGGRVLATLTRL